MRLAIIVMQQQRVASYQDCTSLVETTQGLALCHRGSRVTTMAPIVHSTLQYVMFRVRFTKTMSTVLTMISRRTYEQPQKIEGGILFITGNEGKALVGSPV